MHTSSMRYQYQKMKSREHVREEQEGKESSKTWKPIGENWRRQVIKLNTNAIYRGMWDENND